MSGRFDTTRWSMVLAAREAESPDARRALTDLCEAYWFPLYAFARRQGNDAEQARDLTQGYFAKLLEKDYLGDVDPSAGRFRSFLLASLKNYMANEYKAAAALKRGGGQTVVSLDPDDAEERYHAEPADDETPDRVFERRWAREVLQRTHAALEAEFDEKGKRAQFERLAPFLTDGKGTQSYGEISKELEQSEAATRMTVHRMRRRFGELLRAEVAQTLSAEEEVDNEIRYLFDALQR